MSQPLKNLRTPSLKYFSAPIVLFFFVFVICLSAVSAATKFNFGAGPQADYVYFHSYSLTPDPPYYWLGIPSSPGPPFVFLDFLGTSGDRIAPADYNGDGLTDYGVLHVGGQWEIHYVTGGGVTDTIPGITSGIPQSANFFGDSKAEIVLFDGAIWHIKSLPGASPPNVTVTTTVGSGKPVAEDYDGDRYADVPVYHPNPPPLPDIEWQIRYSSDGSLHIYAWGLPSDIPVPADYDGDGKADIAVFRPSNGYWYILRSSDLSVMYIAWGTSGDKPIPADYDGDGRADPAIYRSGAWWITPMATPYYVIAPWGTAADEPAPHAYIQQ